jgi:hypothetical protein
MQAEITLRQAAQQALDDICGAKLCEINSMSSRAEMLRLMDSAITALRAALAEPEQEPVAWVKLKDGEITHAELSDGSGVDMDLTGWTPLYTAPTPRKPEPLPLKDVERLIYEETKINPNVADDRELLGYIVNAVRAIEAAHGIKEQEHDEH